MATLRLNLFTTENPFKFISPIRKFKDNDPYFSVVDNIPIKQLEENILWIKEALESATVTVDAPAALGRSDFDELKPYVIPSNQNNIIYVNPGRYSARINDAYNLTPLQILTRLSFGQVDQVQTWDSEIVDDAALAPLLNKIISLNASDALGMNGLAERAFVNPFTGGNDSIYATRTFSPLADPGTEDDTFDPASLNLSLADRYPAFFTFLWGNGIERATGTSVLRSNTTLAKVGRGLFYGDSDFVKRWRGVARTAIVDIPDTLSAVVENFTENDFNYYDASNNLNTSLSSSVSSRIDLLFIYSKPVDQVETYINEFTGDAAASFYGNSPSGYSPRKILKAELGILKGAGIQMSYARNSEWFFANAQTALNRPEMLAAASDQKNSGLGFTKLNVAGSFPSPDDLMNTAPLLAEWLPKRHFALVGQSILPIAYVVVRKNQKNIAGNQIVNSEDIIDIRPFFRTTELAYNERAGIAAALPAPSLMNPVATESYVDSQIRQLKQSIIIPSTTGTGNTTTTTVTQAPLLKDQYNEIYIKAPTNKLLAQNPVYFGGKYFGVWPQTPIRTAPFTGGTTAVPAVLTEEVVRTQMQEWALGRTSITDGIYKLDKSGLALTSTPVWERRATTLDQVRWYIFTLQNLPLKLGQIGTESWDILVEPIQAISLNTFVQTPRDVSGFPLFGDAEGVTTTSIVRLITASPGFSTFLPSLIPSITTFTAINQTFLSSSNLFGIHPNLPSFSLDYTQNNNIKAKIYSPFHWVYLDKKNSVSPTSTETYSVFPGWLVQQDFDGTRTVNSDFRCFQVSYKDKSAAPAIPAATNDPEVIKIDRLYKAPLNSYSGKSVDIRVALLVSNRVMVKDIGFKITNMRVG